jgi:hypothetical protein
MAFSDSLGGFPSLDWSGGERKRQNMSVPLLGLPLLSAGMRTFLLSLLSSYPSGVFSLPQIYKD